MKFHIFSMLFLILAVESEGNGFLITAPRVFRVGVNETVFVQINQLNVPVTIYLELEISGIVVSSKKTINEAGIQTIELMIDRGALPQAILQTLRYLILVAESPSFTGRKLTRVLVSKRSGYIFIQTDQPIYNPTQKVRYRIFTLDPTFRPHATAFQISVFNAAGNRIMKSIKTAKGGILKDIFPIPDISKMGTWKITAHYGDDKDNAAYREFKVQKFVLPSFEVNIEMEQRYILLNAEQINFGIVAKYSHGEKVKGAYHCRFGVVEKDSTHGDKMKLVYIRELELTGPLQDGTALAFLRTTDLRVQLQKQYNVTLSELQKREAKLYLGVFVTNIQSGETQEAEMFLPIISHKYTMDLSRTRSYFIPGYPLDVVVVVRLPDGSPASGVKVTVHVPSSSENSWVGTTDQEGAVVTVFNIPTAAGITVNVSAEGLQHIKVIQRASSPSESYLYLSFTHKMYSVGDLLPVMYNTINGPTDGDIYYMVSSHGVILDKGSLKFGSLVKQNLQITHAMVPSFRLIGYYYNQHGHIIADSVWVDVRDECELNVKVEHNGLFQPASQAKLTFDLHGQKARVALLAVDKAIYALNVDNKLTAKQVFSSMQSSDLGCSYGGGSNPESVLQDAGLSFVSQSQDQLSWRKDLKCDSNSTTRQRRSVDLQMELMTLKSNFSDNNLQDCCAQGFSLNPMKHTCQERANRVALVKGDDVCTEAFLKCCLEGERLRQKKTQEDSLKELGRTGSTGDIEQFFEDTAAQYVRRFFPPSFEFTEFDVDDKKSVMLTLPDSITTWEIQVVTLSAATGFCVVKPTEIRAFKKAFVSLTLPYSVKKYEQLSITPVIYNYLHQPLELAVHMEQTEGLCSPASATTTAYVKVTVEPESSQLVSFSVVPMVTGSIPIKIRLFEIEQLMGVDAVEKTLNVLSEGLEKRVQETYRLKLDGRSSETLTINGILPDDTVPDKTSNLFISIEGDGFHSSHVMNLLSPRKVASLIKLPAGCLEQSMSGLAPTVLAMRYLDLSDQWFDLPPGTRDATLDKIEHGYMKILEAKQREKIGERYGSWDTVGYSNWVTAYVVKVLSLVAERQIVAFGQQGRQAKVVVSEEDIRQPVSYLLSVQEPDGSFSDPNPVLHRGVLKNKDQDASMTAYITLALQRSLRFLNTELRNNTEASISRSTTYLLSHFEELQHPYAVAVTAYCLAVCMTEGTDHSSTWTKLHTMATEGKNGCYLWIANASPENQASADAITVETTAYALLTAVKLGHTSSAEKTACWLTTQENHEGGWRSSQDTLMALEALAEYELHSAVSPEANLIADFRVLGKTDIVRLQLENKREKVETDLKKFAGNFISVHLTGKGETKLKVEKVYYLMQPKDHCNQLSIRVTVEGKVKYTDKIINNYDYYDDYGNEQENERVTRSAIEWFDARTRNRRDTDSNLNAREAVTYTVCVSRSLSRNLTGMGIADITLLSGFEAETEDLEMLKRKPEQYISHYEVSYGRVLLYFNKLLKPEECISFDALQRVPIALLQPAPAVFYDYYEPDIKCTVLYSAPRRSNMVSRLCSGDVCQCAERPCHKKQDTFQRVENKRKNYRLDHACFSPVADYAYIVEVVNISMKSNFELYKMNVKEVLRSNGDIDVDEGSVRVFAKRSHCKEKLGLGKQYLIMGKDGFTTDAIGEMQYLLESNTWVERKPLENDCQKSARKSACERFNAFVAEYKLDGCKQ